jgi:hypothetical protein
MMQIVYIVEWKEKGILSNRWFTDRESAEAWAKEKNGIIWEKDVS